MMGTNILWTLHALHQSFRKRSSVVHFYMQIFLDQFLFVPKQIWNLRFLMGLLSRKIYVCVFSLGMNINISVSTKYQDEWNIDGLTFKTSLALCFLDILCIHLINDSPASFLILPTSNLVIPCNLTNQKPTTGWCLIYWVGEIVTVFKQHTKWVSDHFLALVTKWMKRI